MSCDKGKCDGDKCGGGCGGGCDKKKDGRWRKRRLQWMECEPFCQNGGCTPRPKLSCFPAPGATATWRPGLPALCGLLMLATRGGTIVTCVDADGNIGFKSDVAGAPCVFPDIECDPCESLMGPHYNAERRASDVSPQEADEISAAYETEPLEFIPGAPPTGALSQLEPALDIDGNPLPGWYMTTAGNLGLSHEFCLRSVTATLTGAVATPLTVTAVAIAGTRIACGDRPTGGSGHYVVVIDSTRGNTLEFIAPQPGHCPCEPLCAKTPGRGEEVFFMKFAEPLLAAQLPLVQLNLNVRRCDWGIVVDKCVNGIGNRVAMPEALQRRRAGSPSYLP